jgi:hypothetical protein
MSSQRSINPFSVLILFISIVAIILELIGPFAGFYLGGGYGSRFSCLDCEYSTVGDYILQILSIIIFIIIIIIALNDLLPKKFITKDLTKFGFLLSIIAIIFAIAGLASFGIYYAAYDWWPEQGFYAIFVGGILNTIFFYLKQKNV